ncbi:PepSY domain-containing protein [Leptotrichia trevisanii]|uniref:PepSY domain-containing protein n=1 Tax=Leptotrichia trevisanii TaxID=109328 RepID=UPI0026EFF500|nr:PepSY domain-containing protein [Leptotrichia trevisanii]
MKNRVKTITAILMAVLGVTACAAQSTRVNSANISTQNVKISEERAKSLALSQVQGGEVREVELKNKKRNPVYEVEVLKGNMEYEFKIDANTGNILSSKSKTENENKLKSEVSINNVKTKISLEQAKQIALKNSGGGNIKDYELERKLNGYVFEIDILKENTKYEYKINADTGEIISSSMKTRKGQL